MDDVKVSKYTQREFLDSKSLLLFESKDFSQAFGEIALNKVKFKLSWESDLLMPHVLKMDRDIYCVGIDQNFAVVNMRSNEVLFSILLNEYFMTATVVDSNIFVASELQVIALSMKTFTVEKVINLPEIFSDFNSVNSELYALCLDGSRILLEKTK